MTGPNWVQLSAILAIHDRQISRHGSAPGLRDMALLKMSLARAMNCATHTDTGLAEIAAAFAFGITNAHAFVNGNKRTAFSTVLSFLSLNGFPFRSDPIEGFRTMENLTAGGVTETDFAKSLSAGMTRV